MSLDEEEEDEDEMMEADLIWAWVFLRERRFRLGGRLLGSGITWDRSPASRGLENNCWIFNW